MIFDIYRDFVVTVETKMKLLLLYTLHSAFVVEVNQLKEGDDSHRLLTQKVTSIK